MRTVSTSASIVCRRRRFIALVALLAVVLTLASCGSEDASDSTFPADSVSSTEGTVAATAGSETPEPMTVEGIVGSVQARLDAEFAASEHPEGVLGPIELQCRDSGPVEPGDVFACVGMPRTEPDFPLDPVGVVFYVIDEAGTTYSVDGTDLPDSTAALQAMYETAPKGLFCRDLLDDDADTHLFTAAGRPPIDGFFWSLVYWSLEGKPERMDADGNGIPCETLYDPAVVSTVMAGN
ncbi:MAG: hypothetical protein OES24_17365 [Acidimicrobiia bacterium]|nr:hypothetical protein [Acidimicrobiia bacterium]